VVVNLRMFLVVAALAMLGTVVHGADPLRLQLNLNRDWKFALGDHAGAQASSFDDSAWENVGLPHSFSTPYFQGKDFYAGYGWYRKVLVIPAAWAHRRMFFESDGAFQDAEVFVNGTRVGGHQGGYTGFSLEITGAVRIGANLLAVRLNNNWNPRLAPRAGDAIFPGGLYRDVRLVVTDELHVAWYGTFVTTPVVSRASAVVRVQTELQNESASAKAVVLHTELIDLHGQTVARLDSAATIAAGATAILDQVSPPLPDPQLWDPDHPALYTAVTTVADGSTPVDEYRTTFGIRWFEWTADRGFFLNGAHRYFHGADVHQDHAGWANAVTDAGVRRDVGLMKDAGLDFIRGSHYPHHPAFVDACDRLGVLFWSENNFWGVGGAHGEGSWTAEAYPTNPDDAAAFEASVERSLREEIRIFRNHPSIVVWSMCNEVYFSGNQEKVKRLLSRMVALTHELDPTRPAAIGGCQRGGLDHLGDIAGYNGDGARLFINPGIPSVVSEYGSVTSNRPGNYDGQFKPRDGLDADTPAYPWRSGQVVWCGFDYGTIFGPLAGSKGLVDYARLPKRSWYWYRQELRHLPPPVWPSPGIPARLALAADRREIAGTDGLDDALLVVRVEDALNRPIANSPPVRLTIESGPGQFPTGRTLNFDSASDIPIRDGEAAIEFRSYAGGESVIRATSPGLRDAVLRIRTRGEPLYVPGRTPLAWNHPYVRFVRPVTTGGGGQDIAYGRPTEASSEAPGHDGSRAVDGDDATSWSDNHTADGAWWQVDLEQPHTVTAAEVTFPMEGNYRYHLDGSSDGLTWTLLVDQTRTESTAAVRRDAIPGGRPWQFVRITFTGLPPGQPAAVAEVRLTGQHWP
jgi:beta-galactosidase